VVLSRSDASVLKLPSSLHAAKNQVLGRRRPRGIAVVSREISIRVPRTSQGGGGRGPTAGWPGDGGGGGGRGGDDNAPSYGERLRRYRLGLMLALSSVVMLFVSFTTAYVVRKAGAIWDPASNDYVSNWVPLTLPIKILVLNTFVLLLSSFVLEFARQCAAEDVALAPIVGMPGIRVSASRALPWVWTTIVLGFGFLAGQGYAWRQLRLTNTTFATTISSSFFYMLTGVHAVHLIGGILALLYAGVTAWLHRPPETRRIVIDVTAWYWHFMGALWIYIFALLYFAR
jgi:cytochrome c oxidase subunit 3